MVEKDERDNATLESMINGAVTRIVQEVQPLQIILFGSTARGEQDAQGDVDLLVVMPDGTHKRRTAQKLYRMLRGLPLPVDLLVTTHGDLDSQKDNLGLIYRTIVQQGRPLYAAWNAITWQRAGLVAVCGQRPGTCLKFRHSTRHVREPLLPRSTMC